MSRKANKLRARVGMLQSQLCRRTFELRRALNRAEFLNKMLLEQDKSLARAIMIAVEHDIRVRGPMFETWAVTVQFEPKHYGMHAKRIGGGTIDIDEVADRVADQIREMVHRTIVSECRVKVKAEGTTR